VNKPGPQSADTALPYRRLSTFYLWYFASLGALLPYWGLYLQAEGFDPARIGELMAAIMLTKVVAPNIWGWLADRSGRRMATVRLASLLSAIAFAGVFISSNYWWLLAVMTVFSFFWNASLPQFEATTMNYLGKDAHRYGLVRLWGSIGFIITVAGLGPLLDHYGTSPLPVVLLLLFGAIWLASLTIGEGPPHPAGRATMPLGRLLRRPEVIALIGVSFLLQLSHGPYYAFYSIYLEEHGYSRTVIGQLWAIGVVIEVLLFLVMAQLLSRFGARRLWTVALLLTTLRWTVTAVYPEDLALMIAVQTLHAASFGVSHAIAIHLVHRYFTGPNQGRGQALYSSLSFGAGGALGTFGAGYLWNGVNGGTVTFLLAAAAAFAAALWAWFGLRDEPTDDLDQASRSSQTPP
jgi:PPP family 3-phenylpropionic acid transporter